MFWNRAQILLTHLQPTVICGEPQLFILQIYRGYEAVYAGYSLVMVANGAYGIYLPTIYSEICLARNVDILGKEVAVTTKRAHKSNKTQKLKPKLRTEVGQGLPSWQGSRSPAASLTPMAKPIDKSVGCGPWHASINIKKKCTS